MKLSIMDDRLKPTFYLSEILCNYSSKLDIANEYWEVQEQLMAEFLGLDVEGEK